MKLPKCDKCGVKSEVRYQCGDQWLCGPCMPRDRVAMYKGWDPKRPAPESQKE